MCVLLICCDTLQSTEQSRDFLAQKIAGAERALKGSFDEVKVLKTQLSNDEKVCVCAVSSVCYADVSDLCLLY